jgi:hypothetical protein
MIRCPFCAQDVEETELVCPHCGHDFRTPAKQVKPVAPPTPPPSVVPVSRARRISQLVLLGFAIIVSGFVVYRMRQGAGRGGIAGLLMRPQTAQLANADDITLAPGAIQRWEWVATAKQPTCRLTGQVTVVDGGDRDVEVFVLTAANYDSLSNGGMAYAFLQTDRTNTVTLDVTSSEAGRLVFAISNRFSPQAAKVVQLRKVQVVCQ